MSPNVGWQKYVWKTVYDGLNCHYNIDFVYWKWNLRYHFNWYCTILYNTHCRIFMFISWNSQKKSLLHTINVCIYCILYYCSLKSTPMPKYTFFVVSVFYFYTFWFQHFIKFSLWHLFCIYITVPVLFLYQGSSDSSIYWVQSLKILAVLSAVHSSSLHLLWTNK